jgi:hypothetical protein
MDAAAVPQQSYGTAPQYPQQQQYAQQQYAQQQPYQQQPYPQQPGQQYAPAYAQGGYQQQPMLGQAPMALRCPTCMAMAPLGTPYCQSCRTNLAGIVPTPASVPMQGQQGGFLQGNGGKYAMGALGGAAAVLGGEMLLNGIEGDRRDRGDGWYGDDWSGERRHHRRSEGALGELGELADDIGL